MSESMCQRPPTQLAFLPQWTNSDDEPRSFESTCYSIMYCTVSYQGKVWSCMHSYLSWCSATIRNLDSTMSLLVDKMLWTTEAADERLDRRSQMTCAWRPHNYSITIGKICRKRFDWEISNRLDPLQGGIVSVAYQPKIWPGIPH